MKSTRKTTTKKTTGKGKAAHTLPYSVGFRDLTDGEAERVEEIEKANGELNGQLGNAAVCFWHGISFAPPFLKTAIDDAMTNAADQLGIANPATEDDPINQLEKLIALYKATPAHFKLKAEDTTEQRARALVAYVATPKHDFLIDGLTETVMCAADAHNLERPNLEDVASMTAFLAAVPENFGLPTLAKKLTVAEHVAAILNAPGRTVPLSLYNVLADYFQKKIEATGLDAPIPEANRLPVVKMVIAAELAAELERGEE